MNSTSVYEYQFLLHAGGEYKSIKQLENEELLKQL